MKPIEKIRKEGIIKIKEQMFDDNCRICFTGLMTTSKRTYIVVFTIDEINPGELWEHASMSGHHTTPSWDDMCQLKDAIWNEDEECIQYHPKKSEYVNCHPHCLHIWRRISGNSLPRSTQ